MGIYSVIPLALLVMLLAPASAGAQALGPEAEMERLQARADEAMANEDAEGAAMNIGKAALMASELARRQQDPQQSRLYQAAQAVFRAQEQAYRALALFQRAGNHPPASTGVCGSMQQAYQELARASALLGTPPQPPLPRTDRLQASVKDWGATLDGMMEDFQCPSDRRR